MPDARFFLTSEPLAVEAAVRIAGARLVQQSAGMIARAADANENNLADAVIFADTPAIMSAVKGRKIGLCLAREKDATRLKIDGAVGVLDEPRLGFARIAGHLHSERPLSDYGKGVHPTAKLGVGVAVASGALIAADAVIDDNCIIGPYAVIGPGVVIGADGRIGAGASITNAIIGARAAIRAGAKIGEAGFGFAHGPEGLVHIPQLGRVLIGDDVEVGANSTIDRGALGDTEIGDGVKIDNLVQIGHNVKIGRMSVLVSQVGISGSTIIGDGVLIGGQAGIADHLEIGDGARLAAKSGVISNVPAGEKWGGYPARPMKKWLRDVAMLSRLAEARKPKKNNEHD